jgi:hypothetical protein
MAEFSQAVKEAQARRVAQGGSSSIQEQWYIDQVLSHIRLSARQRMHLAVEHMRNKTVKNISIPVTKENIGGKVVVTQRSLPGEFPRADTTNLRKSIFGVVEELVPGVVEGYVGTPVHYGVRLELHMNRSFLLRTFNEEKMKIRAILSGPIK